MYKVKLIARLRSDDLSVAGYAHELDLPFVPVVGMKFKQGTSTWLWETANGELAPKIEEVVYDLDEDLFACLFTVDQVLRSSFWKEFGSETMEAGYFRLRG